MNAVAQTFAIAFASVIAAAAIGVGLANGTAEPATPLETLERVVVAGRQAPAQVAVVTRLPRVVVEQRRPAPNEMTVAQARRIQAL